MQVQDRLRLQRRRRSFAEYGRVRRHLRRLPWLPRSRRHRRRAFHCRSGRYLNPRPLVSELSQDEFFTMMRSGIKPDGQPFPETMPWEIAAGLTDNDLAALYTYLIATP